MSAVAEVLWLDAVRDEDRERVGAKAFKLALLRRQGLPVPEGFVLTTGSGLDDARRQALLAAYRRLGGVVAVRSSSTTEDLAQASFAGQYLTALNVVGAEAVLEAVERCLASRDAAAGYAEAVGAQRPSAMAVLVQRFVEPRAAGVVFTRHPRDPRSALVEAHAGRGEQVMSGRVSAERYVLDRETGALRDGAGASLDAATLAHVVALARRAEELLGSPQDVEWAQGVEGTFILQARPITVEAEDLKDPRVSRLTRANVGEVLPDPVTPLTETTIVSFLEHAFREVLKAAGLLRAGSPPFLVLHRRRLYLNLNASVEVAARLPGISASEAERLILGGGATEGLSSGPNAFALVALLPVSARLAALGRRLPGDIARLEQAISSLPSQAEVDAAGSRRLVALGRRFAEIGREGATTHVAVSGSSALRLALLGRFVSALAPGSSLDRVNRLVSGLQDVESAAPTLALETLAFQAVARQDWRRWLELPSQEAASSWARAEAPSDLAERLREFLERFGHRGLSEGELGASPWSDDPAPVFEALKTLMARTTSPGFAHRVRAEVRHADEEALLSRTGLLGGALLRWALTGAQEGVCRRERTKALLVTLVHHGRSLARAAARQLTASGRLPCEDDVFFLTFDEMLQALEGGVVPLAAVGRRRRRHVREGSLPAPREVQLGKEQPEIEPPPAGALAGLGVSAGVGFGPARVLLPGGAHRLEPGEVLVVEVLDAALGPLLASAAAAVAEMGGMLSHGSVVARELGVPCIVDARGATRLIRTGDRVMVDGGAGTIRMGPAQAPHAPSDAHLDPFLVACDPAEETPHRLEDHPRARESVFFNLLDPGSGLGLIGTLGARSRSRGESMLAFSLPDGKLFFGLDRERALVEEGTLSVAGASVAWDAHRVRVRTRLAAHEADGFPPAPVPLLLAPRTVEVALDLTFLPTTPAVDFCAGLEPEVRQALRPLGEHHVEQSGRWEGEAEIGGRRFLVRGTGSRDHSWGLRDWEALDHSRLFTFRLGDDLAVHALALSVKGRMVEGGFLWRGGRAERVTRIHYATARDGSRLRSFELLVSTAAGAPLAVRGEVLRTITVPVEVDRRSWRHLVGKPYRLFFRESHTRYEAEGRVGYGMAEFTERPGAGLPTAP